MRFEPAIDRARLLDAVRDSHAIRAQELRFEPVGLDAACYVLRGGGDDRYFL